MARKALLSVNTGTDNFLLNDYLPALSEFGHVEPHPGLPRERTVFNAPKKVTLQLLLSHETVHVYDAIDPKKMAIFNPRLRRDDRRHDKRVDLNISEEEDAKPVPSRVSSDIGHYLKRQCDPQDRSHVHIQLVENQFFRRNGVDFKNLMVDQDH
ncbi:Uncharacterized protein ECG_09068 [Echinococcus granulosus]|uniref:Uncharacterized protein n=1 Tax=Echinococcus granulosus TaxID=6210 RepID=A0A068WUR7_ECHGR|nr:Uncharacterized protein ECG_09068 [Echinococcus granulosus]CDS21339.1 hypothetical protein EgrG_000174100 [Echinococcus granulosus]